MWMGSFYEWQRPFCSSFGLWLLGKLKACLPRSRFKPVWLNAKPDDAKMTTLCHET
jgi:hypothetical protein